MLPYSAQGAAQALEDAGTLATILSRAGAAFLDDKQKTIAAALATYSDLRKARAERVQAGTVEARAVLH